MTKKTSVMMLAAALVLAGLVSSCCPKKSFESAAPGPIEIQAAK